MRSHLYGGQNNENGIFSSALSKVIFPFHLHTIPDSTTPWKKYHMDPLFRVLTTFFVFLQKSNFSDQKKIVWKKDYLYTPKRDNVPLETTSVPSTIQGLKIKPNPVVLQKHGHRFCPPKVNILSCHLYSQRSFIFWQFFRSSKRKRQLAIQDSYSNQTCQI